MKIVSSVAVVLCAIGVGAAEVQGNQRPFNFAANTVPGDNQITTGGFVRFEGSRKEGGLLVVGSSYAWHAPKPKELGWSGDWGMAASAREKDAAHIVWSALKKSDPTASLCIAQSAHWERNYTGDVELLERDFASLKGLRPKWICFITTTGNSPAELHQRIPVSKYYINMVEWFRKLNPEAKIVVSVSSRLPGFREAIFAWAKTCGVPVVDHDFLNEEGKGYRAFGQFKHPGVAWHPSDAGFAEMGRRYCEAFGVAAPVAQGAHVYPAAAGEKLDGGGYSATVDGQVAPVLELRHSAMPVNIRWPGHQREKDQTELTGLVRFSFEGSAKVAITAPRDFKEVKVRPQSKGVKPTVRGRTATFEIREPGGYSVEFDGIHEGALVFADAPETVRAQAGEKGVRYFGPGRHEVGAIEMKSGETVYIDEGAVVSGYIHAKDADNIRILGRGILDMSKVDAEVLPIDPEEEKELRRKGFALTNEVRHDAIFLEFCDNVLIDGITIRDSLCYNIRPVCCRNLTIRNVRLCGNWRYNSDGIDMHNCENVRISGCFIRTFDDSICVKGFDYRMDESEMLHDGHLHDVFTNVVIEGCTVWCDWGRALEFGAETRAREIADVTFRNCDVIRADGAVCDIQNCDYADIHDVLFEDIRMEFDPPHYVHAYRESITSQPAPYERKIQPDGQPAMFAASIRMIPEYSKNETRRGRTHDITLRNLKVTGNRFVPRVSIDGFDADHRTTGVTFDGIYVDGREVSAEVEQAQVVGPFGEKPRYIK